MLQIQNGTTYFQEDEQSMDVAYLDHIPVVLQTEGDLQHHRGPKPFRYKAMCLGHECIKIIKESWNNGAENDPTELVMENIRKCGD